MQNTENSAEAQDKKEIRKSRRAEFMALSATLKPLVEQGKFNNINEALIFTYQQKQDEPVMFKTMPQWNKEGYSITPGSKGFAIWGKPRKDARDSSKTYYPIAYVFATSQVYKR